LTEKTNAYPPIYPTIPSAPPDTSWRLSEISQIREQLRQDSINRSKTRKKYKKFYSAVYGVGALTSTAAGLCTAGSLICLSTGVGSVAAVPLGATALGLGCISGSSSVIMKTISKKLNKHECLETLARNRFDTISGITSQALIDGQFSNEEFKLVLKERDSYQKSVTELRSKGRLESIDMQNLKNELISQGRKDALREINEVVTLTAKK